jgi:3-dehydrosphinganine reductase
LELSRSFPSDRIATAAADVSDENALREALDAAEDRFGGCDCLITSAGTVRPGRFLELEAQEFRRQMDVNYHGTVHAVRFVLPGMLARGKGRLLLISSAAGLYGVYGYTAYAASKAALSGLAEALRFELQGSGVSISICYPPDTDTPQLAEENRFKPDETRLLTQKAGLWNADRLAHHVASASERGRFAIYPGFQTAFLGHFGGLAKPALNRWLDRVVSGRKCRREPDM